MAAYTTVHVVPSKDPKWTARRPFLESIARQVGASDVYSVSLYSQPSYWDKIPDNYDSYLWAEEVAFPDALGLWEAQSAVFAVMDLRCKAWGRRLVESLEMVPDSVSGNCLIGCLGIKLGPFSIPDPDYANTVGEFMFATTLHGYGMPIEWNEYLSYLGRSPVVMELLQFLESQAPLGWTLLMSSSY